MAPKPSLEDVEGRFATSANGFHGELVDLNKSMSAVNQKLNGLLALRCQLMGMYGVPADPKWQLPAATVQPPKARAGTVQAPTKGKAKAKSMTLKPPTPETIAKSAELAAKGAFWGMPGTGEVSYKSKLFEAIAKKLKKTTEKDAFTFDVTDNGPSDYTCTLTSKLLAKPYKSDGKCVSKKAAEASAAESALKAEFADFYATLGAAVMMQGLKRKGAPGGAATEINEKQKLMQIIQVVIEKPLASGDIVYAVDEKEDAAKKTKSYTATVTFPGWDAKKKFTGAAGASKKDAEMAAAKVAHEKLSVILKPQLEEHAAKKARVSKEKLDKLKAQTAAKKEAKAEEKGKAEIQPAAKPAAAKPAAAKPAAAKPAAAKPVKK